MKVFCLLFTFFLVSSTYGENADFRSVVSNAAQSGIKEDHFSAVSISVWKDGKKIYSFSDGVVNSRTSESKVTDKTLFDLASLTKPVVTAMLFFYLEKNGLLERNWQVSRFFPSIKREITLFQLLTHNSGLPAYAKLFELEKDASIEKRKEQTITQISKYQKANPSRYGDLNYILLGMIIEKITGKNLDSAFKEMMKTEFPFENSFTYQPLKNGVNKNNVAATSYSPPLKNFRQGVVEDLNSDYLEGVTGHAGLFGTADDISKFYSIMLKNPYYRKFIVDQTGFDKKEGEDSNYGSVADTKCSGHLGWSGTAFLICPEKEIVITILTNRTHSKKFKSTDFTNIRVFRQIVFDAVLSGI
jgi:serine-type D-Ala-D-Ala carboxypeptidase